MHKYFLFLLGLSTTPAFAQQSINMKVQVRSALHAEGSRLILSREWPEKRTHDTIINRNGGWELNIHGDEPAVYSLRTGKPYTTAILYLEPGVATVDIGADNSLSVTGGRQLKQLQAFEKSMAPMEKAFQQVGVKYMQEKDLDAKLVLEKQNRLLYGQLQKKRMAFITRHKNDINGAWMTAKNMFAWNLEEVAQLQTQFHGQPIAASLAAKQQLLSANVMTGKQAPGGVLTSSEGTLLRLDSIFSTNEYTLLDFWASWCAPCRATNRELAPEYAAMRAKGIQVISISADDNTDAWKAAIAADKIPWMQLLAGAGMKSEIIAAYKVKTLPATFLIDRHGKIIKQHPSMSELRTITRR